jgi:hypothetical protein
MHFEPKESFTIRTVVASWSTPEPFGVQISGNAALVVIVTFDNTFQGSEKTWVGWIFRYGQNELPRFFWWGDIRGIRERLDHIPVIVQDSRGTVQFVKPANYTSQGRLIATVTGITSHTAIARVTPWRAAITRIAII